MLAAIGDQSLLDFQQRQVRLATVEAEKIIPMRFHPRRAAIPAHRRGRDRALDGETGHPSAPRWRCSRQNVWPRRCATGLRRAPPDNAFAKIVGKRHSRLLHAAETMNQNLTDSGIATDSIRLDTALVDRI
jgi:hypothetical protein